MPKILSSTALRNGYNDVSEWCHKNQEPVFITKNGNGDLAVMSIDAYEALCAGDNLERNLRVGRLDVEEGRVRPAKEASAALREKYGLN